MPVNSSGEFIRGPSRPTPSTTRSTSGGSCGRVFAWLIVLAVVGAGIYYFVLGGGRSQAGVFGPPTSGAALYSAPFDGYINVVGNESWQDTGILLNTGDHASVTYDSGQWGEDGRPLYGADGKPGYICADAEAASLCVEPIPQIEQGALIGKVGSETFKIGRYLDFVPSHPGELFLRSNFGEANLPHVTGNIVVKISVR